MQTAVVNCRVNKGIVGVPITIETHISKGLPKFSMVGLPETCVKESKDRVRSAIINSHFDFPCARIVVNLAPADLPKEGSRFDLAIALSILAASNQIKRQALADYEFAGELALTGEVRPVSSLFPFAMACRAQQRALVIPKRNVDEVRFLAGLQLYPIQHLLEICQHLNGIQPIAYLLAQEPPLTATSDLDFAEVHDQPQAKRAFEIAAAGGHSVLLIGPPGSGKTMLASRLNSIMPDLDPDQAYELAAMQSISGEPVTQARWRKRPFRAPHHTASHVSLVGGGSPPRPGEISLANHGTLFLDELPEFRRQSLECLREPMESRKIHIARAAHHVEYPAHFQLIAAMNPCPCGKSTLPDDSCICTPDQILRYRSKVSGPLLDRLDMIILLFPIQHDSLLATTVSEEDSCSIRARVVQARAIQSIRGCLNAELTIDKLKSLVILSDASKQQLKKKIEQLNLSARAYHRILRLARTIADLAQQENILPEHLNEALAYRRSSFLFESKQPHRYH